MIKQRAAVLILAMASSILMVGCNNLSRGHLDGIVNFDPGIGYLDGKFRICRENCPKRTEKILDDADYAVMQAPPASIQQPEPPITMPVSIAAPANEHTDIFIVQFGFGKSTPTNDGFKSLALLTKAARQTAVAIELIGETDDIVARESTAGHSARLPKALMITTRPRPAKRQSTMRTGYSCCGRSRKT